MATGRNFSTLTSHLVAHRGMLDTVRRLALVVLLPLVLEAELVLPWGQAYHPCHAHYHVVVLLDRLHWLPSWPEFWDLVDVL